MNATKDDALDRVLSPIAREARHCADVLLDIRDLASRRNEPGKCVACFFRIMGTVSRGSDPRFVEPLRGWLEERLEIVAEDDHSRELERLRVKLEGDDLESFCQGVMSRIHHDRSYSSPSVSLRFSFVDDGLVA